MSAVKENLTVSSVNWVPSTNALNVQVDLSGTTVTVTGLKLTRTQTGTSSVTVTQRCSFSTSSADTVIVDVCNNNIISLLSGINSNDTVNTPFIYVTGFTYGTTGSVTDTSYWSPSGTSVPAFMLAPSTFLTYNSGSSANFGYYAYNYTPITLTVTANSATIFNGAINPLSSSVSQSSILTPLSPYSWLPGVIYTGNMNYSSSTSVFDLSSQVLAITPVSLPHWNPIQYDITDNSFNIYTYYPALFFDICGNANKRYDSPYFGYDSSAQIISTINYTTNSNTTSTLTKNITVQTNASNPNPPTRVPQSVNSTTDVSSQSMFYTTISDLSASSVKKINSISYQVINSVGSVTVSNPPIKLPNSYAFEANDISLNVPSLSNITNNNTIRLDISNTGTAPDVSNGYISSISAVLRDASGNEVPGQNKSVSYFNTSAGSGFNPVIFSGDATYSGTYNVQVTSQDSLGNNGLLTTVPISYVPSVVNTAITAAKTNYSATTGLLTSLDLSLNATSTNASVTLIPMNQNNYFVGNLDASFNVAGNNYNSPASNTNVSIPSYQLQSNTIYLPAVANKVSDTVNMYFTSSESFPTNLYTAVNYQDLSSNGAASMQRKNIYVYDSSTVSVDVSIAWAGSAGSAADYNLLTMISPPAINLVTTRMFVNPQPMSWVVMNNSGLPTNFYIYSFLRPKFNLTTFNTYEAYYQNQFLNSYTMYDYLNISGLTGSSTIALPSGVTQTYNTSYTSYNNNSSVSAKQLLFQDNGQYNVNITGFSSGFTNDDYAIIQGYNITAEVSLIQTLNTAKDISSNNIMGFSNALVTINNPSLAQFSVSSITLLLVRSNRTLENASNNDVLIWNNQYSSLTSYAVVSNTSASQYSIPLTGNISNVLQGTYTMYAIVNLTGVNTGTSTYSVNILTNASSPLDSVFTYPKIIQTAYTNTTGVLATMINNNYDATTTLEIDNVPIQTLAQNVFPSRVVATQLNIPNTANKNVFAELALSNGETNYYTITTTGSTSNPTVVTEYTPSQTFVNL